MIKLSKKWSYAIKAMIYIADNNENLIKISDISLSQKISESLLRRIIADLKNYWILETLKWRNWWIKLTKEISSISVFDILNAIWEELKVRDCTQWKKCEHDTNCSTLDLYSTIQKWLNWILKIYTLDKILKK